MLGYCTVCDKLTPLTLRSYDVARRRGEWYPVTHEHNSKPCEGSRRRLP